MTIFNFSDTSITFYNSEDQDSLIFVDSGSGTFDPTLFEFERTEFGDFVISANNNARITIKDFFETDIPRFDALIFNSTRIDLVGVNLIVSRLSGTDSNDVMLYNYMTGYGAEAGAGDDLVYGADGNDYIFGEDGNDKIYGGSGNDQLSGGKGADYLDGGSQRDGVDYESSDSGVYVNLATNVVYGGDANGDVIVNFENVYGSNFDDIIYGNSERNILFGNAGNDLFFGSASTDYYYGGDGFDVVSFEDSAQAVNIGSLAVGIGGDAQDDYLSQIEGLIGSDYNDTLNGNGGANTFVGGLGNDKIFGASGIDTVFFSGAFANYLFDGNTVRDLVGAEGTDTITGVERYQFKDGIYQNGVFLSFAVGDVFTGTAEIQTFDGGSGYDSVDYSYSSFVKIDLKKGTSTGGFAEGDKFISIEKFIGSNSGAAADRDWFWGDDNANEFWGMDGKDILEGGGGADILDGGAGWDYARYTRSAAAVNVNLATNINTGGDAQGDLLYNIEAVVGSSFDDVIIGGSGNDFLSGENGNDTLGGGTGYDKLYGKIGNDTYLYTAGKSEFYEEGTGIDHVVFDAAWLPSNFSVTGNVLTFASGVNQIAFNDITLFETFSFNGHADMNLQQLIDYSKFNSVFEGTNIANKITGTAENDLIRGLDGNDTLYGEAGNDKIYGDAGNDTIKGRDGDDILYGNDGTDYLEGGNGNDTLSGGLGVDTLKGSLGVDTFVFHSLNDAGDIVQDYNSSAGEKIDISDLLIGYDALTEAITDFVRITDNGLDSFLAIDADGGGDNFIQLATLHSVTGLSDEEALEAAGKLVTV